jgi:hypothetical protein
MQIVVLALAFAAVVAAKLYVDRFLSSSTSRQTVISDGNPTGTVSLPEPEKKM